MTREELEKLCNESLTTDVETAGRAFGISKMTAHKLVRAGTFPVPVLRAGRQYRVPTAGLRDLLLGGAR